MFGDGSRDRSRSPQTQSKAHARSARRPGPRTLSELFSLVDDTVASIVCFSGRDLESAREALRAKASMDLVVTSTYSGTGCFEDSVMALLEAVDHATHLQGGDRVAWAATDWNKASQKFLRAHKRPPEHLFGNVMDRLPGGVRGRLQALESEVLECSKHVRVEQSLGHMTKEDAQREVERLGEKLLDEAMAELEHVEFNESCYCVLHKCECVARRSVACSTQTSLCPLSIHPL